MKKQSLLSLAFALAVGSSTLGAQIVTQNYLVHGSTTDVVTAAKVTVNSNLNTYTIEVDNSILGVGGANGTITSLGFVVPFSDIALGSSGANVSLSIAWTLANPGHAVPSNWTIIEPYDLNAGGNQFDKILGAGVHFNPNGGNPNDGIEFGEKATLVFQLPDFDVAAIAGFFDQPFDLAFRWQEVGLNGLVGGGSDAGHGNEEPGGPGEPTPVPEPATYGMMAAFALIGLIGWRRFAKRNVPAAA